LNVKLYGIEWAIPANTLWGWAQSNPHAIRILFDPQNRNNVWGMLCILPMSQGNIEMLLRGQKGIQNILPTDILPYEAGVTYSCYIPIAAVSHAQQRLFLHLIESFLNYWCEQYPNVRVETLYISLPGREETTLLDLAREVHFTPRFDISSQEAWELRL